jgi:L-ascorbate metabolism protein UlaG (beta-lactamase superfamily)
MIKRRQLIRYAGAGFLTALGMGLTSNLQHSQAQTNQAVSIRFLGHTCFLFTGDGRRILVNPFRPIGCTAGYRPPQVEADLVMISSRLLDEGSVEGLPGEPRLLAEAGIYQFEGMQVQGIATDHDRNQGRRFGTNVVWRWNQGGLNILHMGGAAAPIAVEQQILMGRPDVVLIPVGNGPKAYFPADARDAIQVLNPKIVIPTHYRTQAADEEACDIVPLEDFLTLMEGTPVRRVNSDTISLRSADLPDNGLRIEVLSYPF